MAYGEENAERAKSVRLERCSHCHCLHLQFQMHDGTRVEALLDPDQWAEMFSKDEAFCREMKLIFAQREKAQ